MTEDEERRMLALLQKHVGEIERLRLVVERSVLLDALHDAVGGDARKLQELIENMPPPEETKIYIQMLKEEIATTAFRRRIVGGFTALGNRAKEVAVIGISLAGLFSIGQAIWAWWTGGSAP